ncbi:D-ribose ABC transporter substrate-binding protein [Candidatus Acetothermia bacterium]|nr:MAG: D-ribose ABC transporter substrate-binding protein [Candidatus Acetothermia bacterium]
MKLARYLLVLGLVSLVGFGAYAATIGFSVSTLANPFFVIMKESGEATAAELGIEMITLDAQDNLEKQVKDIEDLIARNVDVLIINPCDSDAIVPSVLQANQAGIPVITVTRPSKGGEVVQHLDVKNTFGGQLVGVALAAELDGVGKVVILEGIPGAPSARERQEGFLNVINLFPDIKVLSSITAHYAREEGATVMEDLLQAHPELDAVYAHNDEMALGAIRAIEAAGRTGIKVFGFDAIPDAIDAIRAGTMVATIKQQPDLQMRMAVETAWDIIQGKALEEIPPVVYIPMVLITKADLD